ncbi:ribosome quality control complex subunit 2 [Apiospora kogelbergensis]|uniref:Ribosome quality control complex subunit 2 n=1 Tax=Apiospora kogelbergensis TaxID=1337665 RepID=A0AAW0R7M9_9PEZI
MSSRQLRKLQKQKELEQLQARTQDSGSESEEAPVQKPRQSVFSGFAALGGAEEDNSDDGDNNKEEAEDEYEEPDTVEVVKPASKKSKKRKKKAKKAVVETNNKNPASSAKSTAPNDDADEIDRALRELNLVAKPSKDGSTLGPTTATVAKPYERICELLSLNTYHLRVINEMRTLFGREAMAAAEMEEQEDEQSRNRRRGQRQMRENVDLETFLRGVPGKSLPEVTLRRNPFLPGKETWPRAATDGLTMKQVKDGTMETKCGTVEFGFAHDQNYNNLERQFFALAQMYEPMQLVHFLHRHPYHVSSLIQVSKIAKQDQNSALAADLCERALFTLGRVSISLFRQKLVEGKARLDFRRPENRQFWLAGYHYLKSLVMKGTYRTALEWTKLILSMDLADPYGVIHFLHPLAIRAHESKWFIDFCDSEALDECDTAQDYIRQTLVLARLQQKDDAGAKALLVGGMERLPWLYSSLFKALGLDVPRAIWGTEPRDEHENLFTELYVHQTKPLWDNTQAIGLLKSAATSAKKSSSDLLAPSPVAGRNVGRFVYLDNTPALMGLVPDGMLHSFPNWDFDPLPPAQEENIFSYDTQKLQWAPDRGPAANDGMLGPLPNGVGRRELEQMLQQVIRDGAPGQVRQALEEALGQTGQNVEVPAGEDDDLAAGDEAQQGEQAGLWQNLMDMIWPSRTLHDGSGNDSDDDDDRYMGPGGWPSDDEDEMPPLIAAAEGPGGARQRDADSDDDMPPSEPTR